MTSQQKPSIADLEAALKEDGDSSIEILPNGEIRQTEPTERKPKILAKQATGSHY